MDEDQRKANRDGEGEYTFRGRDGANVEEDFPRRVFIAQEGEGGISQEGRDQDRRGMGCDLHLWPAAPRCRLPGEVLLIGRRQRRAEKAHPEDQMAQQRVGPERARAEELAARHLCEGESGHARQQRYEQAALQRDEQRLSPS